MKDEEWEKLWQYILKMGQRDDDMCDIKCDWVERLTEWRREFEELRGSKESVKK